MTKQKLFALGTLLFLAVVLVLPYVGVHTVHAQTTTWSVASTTQLGQTAESNGSGNAYAMIILIIPITLGLAAFFFALRWIWHRIAGSH
jgi:cytoskeletal protein RodZ